MSRELLPEDLTIPKNKMTVSVHRSGFNLLSTSQLIKRVAEFLK